MKNFLSKTPGIDTVLDVGSRDVEGNIRDLFLNQNYTGVDMIGGNNVDIVVNGHDMAEYFKGRQFDLVFSFDTFEHDNAFWKTIDNIYQLVKPGGWFVVGVPGRRCPLHEYPNDYWRFMPNSVEEVLLKGYEDVYVEVERHQDTPDFEDEIYGYGRKPYETK